MASLPLDAPGASPDSSAGAQGLTTGINARIDRLPATRTVWMLVFLLLDWRLV